MEQLSSVQGNNAFSKEKINKYGSLVGAAISIFGLLIFVIGLLFDWLKNDVDSASGIKVFFDNDGGEIFRGGLLNSFLCNMPIFLCGTLFAAIFIFASVFWKKAPANAKVIGPIALGVLTVLSCCPGILFFLDLQTRDLLKVVDLGFGYFISLFGLAIVVLGGLIALGVAIYNGAFSRKRST